MAIENNGILFLVTLIFLMGLYFVTKYTKDQLNEGFDNSPTCPDMLIQKGAKFSLYNSKVPKVPGANPIEFESLEEYVEFTEWQRSQGIRCPVLFVQGSIDAQGKDVFKLRPDPLDPQGGLPSTINQPSTTTDDVSRQQNMVDSVSDENSNQPGVYAGFDPMNQTIGENTPIDKLYYASGDIDQSLNAMNPNWQGVDYSRKLIDKLRPKHKAKGFTPSYIYQENEIQDQ